MSLNAFVILQMIIRYGMNTMRYFTVKSMTRAGMFDIMGGIRSCASPRRSSIWTASA